MTELPFPSVTICSPGLNMEAVERAILEDFEHWLSEEGEGGSSLEDQFGEFMDEKYATTAENILEKIRAMNSPPPSSEKESRSRGSLSAVLQDLVGCEMQGRQGEESIRTRRSTGTGETQPQNHTFKFFSYACSSPLY